MHFWYMADILAASSNTGSKIFELTKTIPNTDAIFSHGMQLQASLLEVSDLPSPFKKPWKPFLKNSALHLKEILTDVSAVLQTLRNFLHSEKMLLN